MIQFKDITLVILASTEQQSLRKTLLLLDSICDPKDVKEMLVFLISDTCPAMLELQKILAEETFTIPIRAYIQKIPGLSGGIFEIGRIVTSSHFLIISSDLEMDPNSAPALISASKEHPDAIVCASKFEKGSTRKGYSRSHEICVRAVNAAVRAILRIKGNELLTTFQTYPTALFHRMNFTKPKLTFYEFTFKPVYYGTEYIELPTSYIRRDEGDSNFNLKRYIKLAVMFLYAAVRLRLGLDKPLEQ